MQAPPRAKRERHLESVQMPTVPSGLPKIGKSGDGKRRLQVERAADQNVLNCHGYIL